MRDGWTRATDTLALTNEELDEFIKPAFPLKKVVACRHTQGGLANTNFQLRLSESEHPLLLRILTRDPEQAHKEYLLNLLVEARVPVPHVFHFSPDNPVTGHPYMLMEWIDGVRLETLVATMSAEDSRQIGRAVGSALAGIHSFQFSKAGFLDGELEVTTALDMGSKGLLDYARQCLLNNVGGERLGPELTAAVLELIERRGALLDEWIGQPCLTHCDFGGSNILVGHTSAQWKVAAVLDWEFAISGTPFF